MTWWLSFRFSFLSSHLLCLPWEAGMQLGGRDLHGLVDFSQGCLLKGCTSHVAVGREPYCIVQPRAGDCVYFLFYVISAVFTFFFIVFLPPTEFLFQQCWGRGNTQLWTLQHTRGGKQFSPFSAVQIAAWPPQFNPLGIWTDSGSVWELFLC